MPNKRKWASPTLKSLRTDTEPGRCALCQEPIENQRPDQFICGTLECVQSYDRINKADKRKAQRALQNAADYRDAASSIHRAMWLLFRIQRRMTMAERAAGV
jgi:hypothetical protein